MPPLSSAAGAVVVPAGLGGAADFGAFGWGDDLDALGISADDADIFNGGAYDDAVGRFHEDHLTLFLEPG